MKTQLELVMEVYSSHKKEIENLMDTFANILIIKNYSKRELIEWIYEDMNIVFAALSIELANSIEKNGNDADAMEFISTKWLDFLNANGYMDLYNKIKNIMGID